MNFHVLEFAIFSPRAYSPRFSSRVLSLAYSDLCDIGFTAVSVILFGWPLRFGYSVISGGHQDSSPWFLTEFAWSLRFVFFMALSLYLSLQLNSVWECSRPVSAIDLCVRVLTTCRYKFTSVWFIADLPHDLSPRSISAWVLMGFTSVCWVPFPECGLCIYHHVCQRVLTMLSMTECLLC